ncbi:hypothetical protein Q31b_30410 [Novipirellula aureliae]|uniref:Uncharacterized protein n=1 Tax=Novipirellula aureliae TaxID=2527966 RepID=A0A5C6DY33_9BACT|nr:hypothetical protein Q31b_30410 [Novipirellula aureliae]
MFVGKDDDAGIATVLIDPINRAAKIGEATIGDFETDALAFYSGARGEPTSSKLPHGLTRRGKCCVPIKNWGWS